MTAQNQRSALYRASILGYGLIAYAAFQLLVLYYIGFLANVVVPKGIDEGVTGPTAQAFAINIGLITLFGLQHSVMARGWFKTRWTRLIPEPIERSTYVLSSVIVLFAIAWFWRPLPTVIWDIDGLAGWAIWGVFGLGLVIIILSSSQIDHASLFGLKQVYAFYRGREFSPPSFQTPGFYRYVRHPLMTGTLLWVWATPHMTVGHLLFAAGFTVYILVGTHLEEQMLLDAYGEDYEAYRRRVPRFFPRQGKAVDSGSFEEGTPED